MVCSYPEAHAKHKICRRSQRSLHRGVRVLRRGIPVLRGVGVDSGKITSESENDRTNRKERKKEPMILLRGAITARTARRKMKFVDDPR